MSVRKQIEEQYPKRVYLTPAEVAAILLREGRSGEVQTRKELAEGKIIPGLKKREGRWIVPVEALIESLDSLVTSPADTPVKESGVTIRKTRIVVSDAQVKPRHGRLPDALKRAQARTQSFWQAVFIEIEYITLTTAIGDFPNPIGPSL